jgi:hypothetical protein
MKKKHKVTSQSAINALSYITKPSEAYLTHEKHYTLPNTTLKEQTLKETTVKLPQIHDKDVMRTQSKRYGPFKVSTSNIILCH